MIYTFDCPHCETPIVLPEATLWDNPKLVARSASVPQRCPDCRMMYDVVLEQLEGEFQVVSRKFQVAANT